MRMLLIHSLLSNPSGEVFILLSLITFCLVMDML